MSQREYSRQESQLRAALSTKHTSSRDCLSNMRVSRYKRYLAWAYSKIREASWSYSKNREASWSYTSMYGRMSVGSDVSYDMEMENTSLDVDMAVANVQMESEDENPDGDLANISFTMETSLTDRTKKTDHPGGSPKGAELMDLKFEIKDELALLSKSISEVQTVDGYLFEAKVSYQREITEARRKLYKMYKAHRAAIEKAKPYFVAKELEAQLLQELDEIEGMTEKSRFNFEDSKENEEMAGRALQNAQTRKHEFSDGDHTMIMENWNRATQKVLEASRQRADSEDTLRRKEEQYLKAQSSADQILMDIKGAVQKAWPYYSMKDQFEKQLEKKRREVHKYGRQLAGAKENYKATFARLSLVATEIQQRKSLTDKNEESTNNMSQFEEVTDIDSVLSALESKAENLSSSFEQMEAEDDFQFDLMMAPSLAHFGSKSMMPRSQSLLTFTPASDEFRYKSDNMKTTRNKSLTGSTSSLDLDKKIAAELKKNRKARMDEKRRSLDLVNPEVMNLINKDDGRSNSLGNDLNGSSSTGDLTSVISTSPLVDNKSYSDNEQRADRVDSSSDENADVSGDLETVAVIEN